MAGVTEICNTKDLTLIPENVTYRLTYMISGMDVENGTLDEVSGKITPNYFLSFCNYGLVFNNVCCVKSTDRIVLSIPLTFQYGNAIYKVSPRIYVGGYGESRYDGDYNDKIIIVNIVNGDTNPFRSNDNIFVTAYGGYLHIFFANNRYTIENVTDDEGNTTCSLKIVFERFLLLVEKIKDLGNECSCEYKSNPGFDLCSRVKWTIGGPAITTPRP